jgi:hypothetical protein
MADKPAVTLDDLMQVQEACRQSGLSNARIRQLCDRGTFEAVRDSSGRRLIVKTSFARWLADRQRRKRLAVAP